MLLLKPHMNSYVDANAEVKLYKKITESSEKYYMMVLRLVACDNYRNF